ncbi:MAG: hypothetical protein ACRDQ4_01745 [Pseudonocardiaceae bacterium]
MRTRAASEAFPELEHLIRSTTTNDAELGSMPANFGSTVKHAFTTRQFAQAFGAGLVSASALRLVLVPRLTDTRESAQVRRLSEAEARQVVSVNCFTPRDEFWVRPWLVPRRRPDEQLGRQANAAIRYIAATVPCVEVSFGVHNPVNDLARILDEAMGGIR